MRKGTALFNRSRTMFEQTKKKPKPSTVKKEKKKLAQMQSHDGKIDELDELDADDEGAKNSTKRSKEKDSNDNDEEKDKVAELKNDGNA